MQQKKQTNVAIGFATGRSSFQKVLRTNIYNWRDSGLVADQSISLNLLVSYDLHYNKTKRSDYTNIRPDLAAHLQSALFLNNNKLKTEAEFLAENGVATPQECALIFGRGYAARRNAILYFAIKNHMDALIFLDDDEYPMAVTNTRKTCIWGGQHVLATHLSHIAGADITHGYHCGYVSPIPSLVFNETLREEDFRLFIEAISNDIINWDSQRAIMANGGVTYADTQILTSGQAVEVQEQHHTKFISGANLCINLTDPTRVYPFYNPPQARGEDTFLSTCLGQRKVLQVPCYTFHDGFSTYHSLLEGVLPIRLQFIHANDPKIIQRFYRACVGWIRYKPLLLYLTQPERYEQSIATIRAQLQATLPKVCAYFQAPEFANILAEFERYQKNVEKHAQAFQATQLVWHKIMEFFSHNQ